LESGIRKGGLRFCAMPALFVFYGKIVSICSNAIPSPPNHIPLQRAEERGTNIEEIQFVLEHGVEMPARGNRKAKAKVFSFKKERLGKYYEEKRVEVIYFEEDQLIITVTVYVFYGEWEA